MEFLKQQEGFENLEPFSEDDRRAIQQETWRQWKAFSESLGPEAVRNYERVIAALKNAS